MLPVPLDVHVAPFAVTHDQVTLFNWLGAVYCTKAPVAIAGPLLPTTTVYVTEDPVVADV